MQRRNRLLKKYAATIKQLNDDPANRIKQHYFDFAGWIKLGHGTHNMPSLLVDLVSIRVKSVDFSVDTASC